MSCQINLLGNIAGVREIKKFLFLPDFEEDPGNNSWLQKCILSVSPIGDIIVIGRGKKMVILTSKWDSNSSSSIFQQTFSGTVHESDNIKSVLCVPIVTQSKSSNILPDWTCILLGFDSGYVRAYVETCELIYEEQFHNEKIISLKCRSQHTPQSSICLYQRTEEIYVQYQTNFCIIKGKQLIPILRSNRSQLARVQANSELLEFDQQPLEVKKWEFQDQSVIKDIAIVHSPYSNLYDHLLAVSTSRGFDTNFKSVPPNDILVLAVGWKPFLGFHFAAEASYQPMLSDVAKIVAYKLKSALPSWLTGGEKHDSVIMEPTDPMVMRFGLCDLHRSANTIILTDDQRIGAISDNLGRIIIIDIEKGIALKILKGYRDAQCSFIQVVDVRHPSKSKVKKVALFLVIYSPKKGTLEIFTTQQFLKIATFSASKNSRLVYINYNMMGFSEPTESNYNCQFTTLLIDDDGKIKEIIIPFHFALNEESSKKARDIYVFKMLKDMIRSEQHNNDFLVSKALKTVKDVHTLEMKKQLVELLSSIKSLPTEFLLECMTSIMENLTMENDFTLRTNNIISFLSFYHFMKSNMGDEAYNSYEPNKDISLCYWGCIDVKHLKHLVELIDPVEGLANEPKVQISEEQIFSLADYLALFLIEGHSKMRLLKNYDESVANVLCASLFGDYIKKCKHLEHFKNEVIKSNIRARDLFLLLIMYWVNQPLHDFSNIENLIDHLVNVLYVLIKVEIDESPKKTSLKYFWEDIREVLTNSRKPFLGLIAAMACKYIAYKIERDEDPRSVELGIEDLEIWSKENVEWKLLIAKLEDVAILNIMTDRKHVGTKYHTLPKLSHQQLDVSLKFVLQRKGSVSELVARWLTTSGIDPVLIVLNDKIYQASKNDEEVNLEKLCPKEKRDFLETDQLFSSFNAIRIHWPYSLNAGMILTNMCWEYALKWKDNIRELDYLKASISCLKAIPNLYVKIGLFNLIWKTYLNTPFKNTIKLIDRVTRVPKLKLCMQDTGLSDAELRIFIKICTDYLDTFTDIVQDMYNQTQTPLQFEPLWENGGQPLVELAIQQTDINYELLLVHFVLSMVFHMMCHFFLKAARPMASLFDEDVVNVFFLDFQQKPEVDFSKSTSNNTTARLILLKKVISSSIEAISTKDGEIYWNDHPYWMEKSLLLGRIWQLDLEILRVQRLVQFFIHGHDTIGHDLISQVNDRYRLGRELLTLLGKRLRNYMGKSPDMPTIYTFLTPHVTGWIEGLNKDWCADSTFRNIRRLARLTVYLLDSKEEKGSEHKLAHLIFEATEELEGIIEDD